MTAEDLFPYSTLPKVPVTACPVCGATGNPARDCRDRYGYHVALVTCQDCRLQYLAEQLTRDGYARLYNGAYRPLIRFSSKVPGLASMTEAQYTAGLRDSQAHYGAWLARHLRRWSPPVTCTGPLLDAGGSLGTMAHALGLTPSRVTVLDPAAAELAQAPAGVETIQGWLEDPMSGEYDAALCLETMDHVTQPLAAFRHLRAAVPRGWLLADYVARTALKIDHPVRWIQTAWRRALRMTGWTVHAWWPMLRQVQGQTIVHRVVTLCR